MAWGESFKALSRAWWRGRRPFAVGKRLQAVDQAPAQAGPQVFPQDEVGRGLGAAVRSRPPLAFKRLKRLKRAIWPSLSRASTWSTARASGGFCAAQAGVGGGVDVGEAAGLQQMAAAGASLAPQAEGGFAAGAGQPGGERCQVSPLPPGTKLSRLGLAGSRSRRSWRIKGRATVGDGILSPPWASPQPPGGGA